MSAEIRDSWPDAEIELVGGGRGVFDVAVDGEVVFSRHAAGRHIMDGELTETLRHRSA